MTIKLLNICPDISHWPAISTPNRFLCKIGISYKISKHVQAWEISFLDAFFDAFLADVDAAGAAVDAAVGAAVGAPTDIKAAACLDATGDAAGHAAGNATGDAAGDAAGNATGNAAGNATGNAAVGGAVGGAVGATAIIASLAADTVKSLLGSVKFCSAKKFLPTLLVLFTSMNLENPTKNVSTFQSSPCLTRWKFQCITAWIPLPSPIALFRP